VGRGKHRSEMNLEVRKGWKKAWAIVRDVYWEPIIIGCPDVGCNVGIGHMKAGLKEEIEDTRYSRCAEKRKKSKQKGKSQSTGTSVSVLLRCSPQTGGGFGTQVGIEDSYPGMAEKRSRNT